MTTPQPRPTGPGLPQDWDAEREAQRFQKPATPEKTKKKVFSRGTAVGEVMQTLALIGVALGVLMLIFGEPAGGASLIGGAIVFYVLSSVWVTLCHIGTGLQDKGHI